MNVKMYPVKFEAYDNLGDQIFTVTAYDEACSTVDIKSPMDVALWDVISPMIRSALVQAHGEGGGNEQ